MKKSEIIARATIRKYEFAAEYLAGATLQQVAERHGLTRQRVHAMLKSIGVTMRKRGKVKADASTSKS